VAGGPHEGGVDDGFGDFEGHVTTWLKEVDSMTQACRVMPKLVELCPKFGLQIPKLRSRIPKFRRHIPKLCL
jgi:hypothetical protein